MTASKKDPRTTRMEYEVANLAERLRTHGLWPAKLDWKTDKYEPVESWTGTIIVLDKDDRPVAKLSMNTGISWHSSSFHGWKCNLPQYEPRGAYNLRENARDPADPDHWGFANIKCTSTVVEKIVAGMCKVPNQNDVEIGKLRVRLDSLERDSKHFVAERRNLFRDKDVLEELHAFLTRDDIGPEVCSEKLQKRVRKLTKALGGELRINRQKDELWEQIAELEGDSE